MNFTVQFPQTMQDPEGMQGSHRFPGDFFAQEFHYLGGTRFKEQSLRRQAPEHVVVLEH